MSLPNRLLFSSFNSHGNRRVSPPGQSGRYLLMEVVDGSEGVQRWKTARRKRTLKAGGLKVWQTQSPLQPEQNRLWKCSPSAAAHYFGISPLPLNPPDPNPAHPGPPPHSWSAVAESDGTMSKRLVWAVVRSPVHAAPLCCCWMKVIHIHTFRSVLVQSSTLHTCNHHFTPVVMKWDLSRGSSKEQTFWSVFTAVLENECANTKAHQAGERNTNMNVLHKPSSSLW